MKVGTGRITKIVMEFLKAKGNHTLITNEVDHKFVIQKALENNIGISDLLGKTVRKVDFTSPITAITIDQT